jgi:hypothetical protein
MLWLWIGCSEPFEHNASDLIEPRIASVSLQDGIMVWSGEGLFHQEQPEIYWHDSDGNEISQGYDIPQYEDIMMVSVFIEEVELQTEVHLTKNPIDLQTQSYVFEADIENTEISKREDVEIQTLEDFLENNSALTEAHVWRIELQNISEDTLANWFTPLLAGTSLPLSTYSTDIYPFELRFDEGELISSESVNLEAALVSVTKAEEQGQPSIGWKWMGVPREGAEEIQERWMLSDTTIEKGGWYQATIAQNDDIWGISLDDVVELEDFETENLSDFQDDISCLHNQEIRFDWIVSGRCSLNELVGAKVVFEP